MYAIRSYYVDDEVSDAHSGIELGPFTEKLLAVTSQDTLSRAEALGIENP